jgi:hypothetical protein
MVSICATCKNLQKQLKTPSNSQESDSPTVLQLVDTTLPNLRRSSGSCRACSLLLQGILLHHDRFTGIQEENIRIVAESYQSSQSEKAQDHLSVDLRWQKQTDGYCEETPHEPEDGYPDLRLEFFADGSMYFEDF